jgi:hypothetical protein
MRRTRKIQKRGKSRRNASKYSKRSVGGAYTRQKLLDCVKRKLETNDIPMMFNELTEGVDFSQSTENILNQVRKNFLKLSRSHHPNKGGNVTISQELNTINDMIKSCLTEPVFTVRYVYGEDLYPGAAAAPSPAAAPKVSEDQLVHEEEFRKIMKALDEFVDDLHERLDRPLKKCNFLIVKAGARQCGTTEEIRQLSICMHNLKPSVLKLLSYRNKIYSLPYEARQNQLQLVTKFYGGNRIDDEEYLATIELPESSKNDMKDYKSYILHLEHKLYIFRSALQKGDKYFKNPCDDFDRIQNILHKSSIFSMVDNFIKKYRK